MKALLQKDMPWLLGFLVAGTLALAGAIAERSFVGVFIAPVGQYEALFYVACIAGLLLGATAACYDEVLGTREFLRQRPVSMAHLANARLFGCAIVLASWYLLAPLLAWIGYALFDPNFQFGYCSGLPALWGTMLVALSACAIGCFAGALPAPWWLRLCVACALFVGSFQAIDNLSFREDRLTEAVRFLGGHCVVAACLFPCSHLAMRGSADADRPWPQRLRAFAAGTATAGLALVFLLLCTEAESRAVHLLHRTYPHPVVQAGEVVLIGELPMPGQPRRIVDAAHQPTGRAAAPTVRWLSRNLPAFGAGLRGIERPRWSSGSQTTWTGSYADAFGGRLLLASDGSAWWWPPHDGVMQRTGKGEGRQGFAHDSQLRRLDNGKSSCVVAVDAGSNALWRFDLQAEYFVPEALPGGDRFVRIAHSHDRGLLPLAPALRAMFDDIDQVDLVQGENSLYVWDAGTWRAVAPTSALAEPAPPACNTVDTDPLHPAIEVPPLSGVAPFRHEYAPRTAWEQVHASTALFWSALRPPLAQVVGHTLGRVPSRDAWLDDPLVAGGRRPWLVLACLALALLMATGMRRRLRALHAPAATVGFWTAATFLLGPAAALACIAFERPRAYARRALLEPFASPRIITPLADQEVVA